MYDGVSNKHIDVHLNGDEACLRALYRIIFVRERIHGSITQLKRINPIISYYIGDLLAWYAAQQNGNKKKYILVLSETRFLNKDPSTSW